ncbi:hypothetical protein ACFFRC_19400, partial [Amycolatopsis halotolerans]
RRRLEGDPACDGGAGAKDTALAGKTSMTFHQAPFPNAAERDGHVDGWQSSFEDLTHTLEEME